MTRHVVRYAKESDLDALLALFEARADWIADHHRSDQWRSVGRWRDRIARNIRLHATHVLCFDGDPNDVAGTITLSRHGDAAFWARSGVNETLPSLYLAKLATDPRRAGHGLGDLLLDWATDVAYRRCLHQLRLDAWKTAPGLHRYYRRRQWTDLGVVDVPGRMSGALFVRTPRAIDLTDRLVRTGHRLAGYRTDDPWMHTRDNAFGVMPSAGVGLVSDDGMEPETTLLPVILPHRPERMDELAAVR